MASNIINFGMTTKSYLAGLKAELEGLDSKADNFKAAGDLIRSEISLAEKNLKAEQDAAAAAEAAELDQ